MSLAKYDDMVKAVPADRADRPFAIFVLPWRLRRYDRQVHRRNAVGMIAQKRLPSLRRRLPSFGHVLGNSRLSDIDAELKQFAMNPRGAPERIGKADVVDQPADLKRRLRAPTARP